MSDDFNYEYKPNFQMIEDTHPDETSSSNSSYSFIPEDKPKKRKKGRMKKVVSFIMAGVLFGGAAGGTFVGVTRLSDRYLPTANSQNPTYTSIGNTGVLNNTSNTPASGTATNTGGVMDVSAVVEQVMPSIVAITSTTLQEYQGFFGGSQTVEIPSSGSGIIVGQNDTELLIATNNHVVADSSQLTVTFIDQNAVEAVIKGTDPDSDLAVIAVPMENISAETLAQIKVATLGDSDSAKVGQGVIAIGNALGYGQSVTVGYVSALNREMTVDNVTRRLIQTDAAINPGNSGGALLNMKGEVIGINAAKYSGNSVEGMGYAIPISNAQEILQRLMNKTTRTLVDEENQGYIGIKSVYIEESTLDSLGIPKGAFVYEIVDGSPAAASDLRAKDVITKFDDERVYSMADIQELLTYYEGGSEVTLTVQRLVDGEYVEVNIDLTLGYKTGSVE